MLFPGREIMELTTNVIAESMYIQCDVDGNEYLVLNLLIDYWKNGKKCLWQTRISVCRADQ